MSQDLDFFRGLVRTTKSVGSALRSIVKEGVHRLTTHFEEWPERYIEMRASLYRDHR